MKLDDFLKFEEEHDLLKYKFSNSGYCMWPYIRFQIVSYLVMGDNTAIRSSEDNNLVRSSKLKILGKLFLEYFNSIVQYKNIGRLNKSRLLFVTNDRSDIPSQDGWYNRNLDGFADCNARDSQIIILSDNTRHTPRRFQRFYFDVRHTLNSKVLERINSINTDDKHTAEMLINELKEHLPEINDYLDNRIMPILYRKCKCIDFDIKHIKALIKKVNPEIAIVEDGCYGYDKSILIKTFKDNKITVMEPQHGLIGLNHPAYNYSYSKESEYNRYLPDYYLSYGQYWESVSRLPIKVIPVGAPNFYSNLVDGKEKKGRILIALTDYSSYWIDFVKDCLSDKKEVDIVIKAHPLSTNLLDDFREFEDVEGIELCAQGNIYDFISEAEFIMSDMSTVIFEAYCKKKKVFVYDCEQSNNFIPKEIGFRIKSYSDFNSIVDILDNSNYLFADNVDYYFNSNWRDNYTKIFTRDDSV